MTDKKYNFEYKERKSTYYESFFTHLEYINLSKTTEKRIKTEYTKYIELFGEDIDIYKVIENIHTHEFYDTHLKKKKAVESMIFYIEYCNLTKPLDNVRHYYKWLKQCIYEIKCIKNQEKIVSSKQLKELQELQE